MTRIGRRRQLYWGAVGGMLSVGLESVVETPVKMDIFACKSPRWDALALAAAASPRPDGQVDAILYALAAALIIVLVYGIVKMASRSWKMTEEEFEAEARRASGRGHVTGLLQKIFDPSHRVEYVQQQSTRVEADEDHSGDRPEAGRLP